MRLAISSEIAVPWHQEFHIKCDRSDIEVIVEKSCFLFFLMFVFTVVACNKQQPVPVVGRFSGPELQQFAALNPIDAHAHVFVSNPAFYAMLNRLNLHLVDILVVDDTNESRNSISKERQQTWDVCSPK